VPRATAFDNSLAACVAVAGSYELVATALSHFLGAQPKPRSLCGRQRREVAVAENLMASDPTARWAVTDECSTTERAAASTL
jgi:hypothetical protein